MPSSMPTLSPYFNRPQQQQQPQGGGNGQYGSTNRYIPPTFNWGSNAAGQPTDYSQMNWNTMQDYYMPQQTNNPYGNQYMSSLQQMLGQFGGQYGGPNRRPMMPNFGSYNPGFGGPTSFYDQSQGGGFGGGYGNMPQFNPYMLMQNRLRGMSQQDMFPPWMAGYYGGGGLGSLTPNSQQGGNGVNVGGETKPLNLGGGG